MTRCEGESLPAGRGCDHLDDAELVARFEACTLPAADYGHREHLRVAYSMLRGADFGDAACRFRAALRRYVTALGAAAKYHETLTWAYLALLHQRMTDDASPVGDPRPAAPPKGGAVRSSTAFLARHPELLDHRAGALAEHYDVAAITASPRARAVFVLPTRA